MKLLQTEINAIFMAVEKSPPPPAFVFLVFLRPNLLTLSGLHLIGERIVHVFHTNVTLNLIDIAVKRQHISMKCL